MRRCRFCLPGDRDRLPGLRRGHRLWRLLTQQLIEQLQLRWRQRVEAGRPQLFAGEPPLDVDVSRFGADD